jgi:hypothetical protein
MEKKRQKMGAKNKSRRFFCPHFLPFARSELENGVT